MDEKTEQPDVEPEETPKTDQDLKKLALDISAGKIFTDRHIRGDDMLPMVFMPLALMGKDDLKRLIERGCHCLYEYLDKANAGAINGMPTFFSFQYMTKEESSKVWKYVEHIEKTNKDFIEGMF